MNTLGQLLIGGAVLGAVYGVVALGFALTIRGTRLINLAHPELVMVGGLFGYSLMRSGVPYLLVILLVALFGVLLGLLMDVLVLQPLLSRRANLGAQIIATVGVAIALRQAAVLIWGADPLKYPRVYSTAPVSVLGAQTSVQSIVILAVAGLLIAGVAALVRWTRTGIAVRAASSDREAARTVGIRPSRTDAATLALSSGLGTSAGVLLAPLFFASPALDLFGLKAFAATAMGGMDSLVGAAVGGLVLGEVETLGGFYISTAFKDSIAFAIMIAVLLARPQGLLLPRRRLV